MSITVTKELNLVLSVDGAKPALLMTLHSAIHAALESSGAEVASHAEYRPFSGGIQMSYQVGDTTERGFARKYSELLAEPKDFKSNSTLANLIKETASSVGSTLGTAIIDDNGVDVESHPQKLAINFLRGLSRVGSSLNSYTSRHEKQFFSTIKMLVQTFDALGSLQGGGKKRKELRMECEESFATALHGVLTFPVEESFEAWVKYQNSHDALSPVWIVIPANHQMEA